MIDRVSANWDKYLTAKQRIRGKISQEWRKYRRISTCTETKTKQTNVRIHEFIYHYLYYYNLYYYLYFYKLLTLTYDSNNGNC